MADEIKIIRGDSVSLIFDSVDCSGEVFDPTSYEVLFETDSFNKTTVDNPTEVVKGANVDGNPIITVHLTSEDTDDPKQRDYPTEIHFKLKLYTTVDNPPIVITGASGRIIIVDEK